MNFSEWSVVGFLDDTGIGWMTRDIQEVLGVGHHLVAPSERLEGHSVNPGKEMLLAGDASLPAIQKFLQGLDGIICIERLHWHPFLIPAAKSLGIKTVCVPMWEWFRGTDPDWKDADLFLCPNHKAVEILRYYGYSNVHHVPWPLDIDSLPLREIRGKAKTFFHNAGLVDHDDRKGTSHVVRAFSKLKDPGIRLILRIQKEVPLETRDPRIDLRIGNLDNPSDLYKEGDVAIQPSLMEGLGFMVLEPVCCGIPVISTASTPMNEYVREPEMLALPTFFKKKSFAFRAASIRHAFLTPPRISSLAKRIEWCCRNDMEPISKANRAWAKARHSREIVVRHWQDSLTKFFSDN